MKLEKQTMKSSIGPKANIYINGQTSYCLAAAKGKAATPTSEKVCMDEQGYRSNHKRKQISNAGPKLEPDRPKITKNIIYSRQTRHLGPWQTEAIKL